MNDILIMNISRLAAAIAISAGMIWVSSCGNEGEKALGPGETVEAFVRALTEGNTTELSPLCDTTSMKEYIEAFTGELERLQKDNSTIAAIAVKMISESEISIEEIIKEGDKRKVIYKISGPDGSCRCKTAIVKKEEGAWKVERITDRL